MGTMKDMLRGLARGDMVMMPQNFYAEAYRVGIDENGNECIVSYPGNEKVSGYDILAMLLDEDVLKWSVTENEFPDKTVAAFCEYYADDEDCVYEGPQQTDYVCNRCGTKSIVKEDESNYPLYCYTCDENKYTFEVEGCPESEAICAYYDDGVSDSDRAFFDIDCPDETGKKIEVEVSILTDEFRKAWLAIAAMANDRKIFYHELCIGEWSSELELAYSISSEYITVPVKNSADRVTLQIKVQKDEPGIIFDLIRYEMDPSSGEYLDKEETIEDLGYLTMEDCGPDDVE
jgi:hypothetical protein